MINLKDVSNIFDGLMFYMDSLKDINNDYEKELDSARTSRTEKRIRTLNKLNKLVSKCVQMYADNKIEVVELEDEEKRTAYSEFLESLKRLNSIIEDTTQLWDDNDSINTIKKEMDSIYSSFILDMKDIERREDMGLKSK